MIQVCLPNIVVFAARLREAKKKARMEWSRVYDRTHSPNKPTNMEELEQHLFSKHPNDMVHVKILPGMSHGFMQMTAFLPEASQVTNCCSDWIMEMFQEAVVDESNELTSMMLTEMQEISETSVLLRRRASMASRIGLSRFV